jgi:hypothetical protein
MREISRPVHAFLRDIDLNIFPPNLYSKEERLEGITFRGEKIYPEKLDMIKVSDLWKVYQS